jgi:hypothetical protein
MKNVYMVHKGKRAILTYNKQRAKQIAKLHNADGIRYLSYGYYKDCHFVMDFPTFYAVSDPLN